MLACLNESLRRYPPVAGSLPRIIPKGGAMIDGKFVPEGVSCSSPGWAAAPTCQELFLPSKPTIILLHFHLRQEVRRRD